MPVPPTSRYFQVASKARGVPLKCSSGTAASVTRLRAYPQQTQMPGLMARAQQAKDRQQQTRQTRGWAALTSSSR